MQHSSNNSEMYSSQISGLENCTLSSSPLYQNLLDLIKTYREIIVSLSAYLRRVAHALCTEGFSADALCMTISLVNNPSTSSSILDLPSILDEKLFTSFIRSLLNAKLPTYWLWKIVINMSEEESKRRSINSSLGLDLSSALVVYLEELISFGQVDTAWAIFLDTSQEKRNLVI